MKIRVSTDEDPGLRIESFAVINLRGVSTNKTLYALSPCKRTKNLKQLISIFTMQIYKLQKQLNEVNKYSIIDFIGRHRHCDRVARCQILRMDGISLISKISVLLQQGIYN